VFGATLTVTICAALVAAALAPLWRADSATRRRALVACCLVLAASLPHFTTTPDGPLQDSLEYAGDWIGRLSSGPRSGWEYFFGLYTCVHGVGWSAWPVAFGKYLTGTWLAERVIGLGWHLCLVVALVTAPFADAGVLIAVAVASATRFGLWTQRHHQGSDMLVQQVLLLVALWRAERSRWWAAAAGLLTGLAVYNYIPGWARLAYPAVVLRGGPYKRMALIYGIAALTILPALLAGWPEDISLTSIFSRSGDHGMPLTPPELLARTSAILRAFVDPTASTNASWCWSFIGAQHLPLIAVACILLGIAVALWSRDGHTWILLAIGGLMPNLLSDARLAASHREIMALIPLAMLAGYSVRVVPVGWRRNAALVLAAAIAVAGYLDWVDPQFWSNWSGGVHHGFVDGTMTRGGR
jgi:hypothetical protein